jgi:hypothetical protein
MIQVKIPAPRAVGEAAERQGHAPGIKPAIARVTSPWTAPGKCEREIQYTGSMRAEAIRAAALRADHKWLTSVAHLTNVRQDNQKLAGRQHFRSAVLLCQRVK